MNCKKLDCDLEFNYITVDFEDGESEDCLVAGLYEVDGKKYLSVVVGVTEDSDLEDDEIEGYIYEYADVNGEEFELLDIESDEEFARIAEIIEAYEDAQEE